MLFAPFLYCNDICSLHVHSFPSLGWQQKMIEMRVSRRNQPGMEGAAVSIHDRKVEVKQNIYNEDLVASQGNGFLVITWCLSTI